VNQKWAVPIGKQIREATPKANKDLESTDSFVGANPFSKKREQDEGPSVDNY